MGKIKIVASALALCITLAASGCSAGLPSTEYKTDITIEQITTGNVAYSQETKDYAVENILSTIKSAVTSVYGDKAATEADNYTDSILLAVECCESRSISESDLLALIRELCGQEELLASLLAESRSSDIYSAVRLFGIISEIAGADNACLLVYDFSLIYCNYEYEQYYGLYSKYSYPYLLRYAEKWEARIQSIQSIGEENFRYLLKTVVSAISLNSGDYEDAEALFSDFSAGEAALYLRAQGYMAAKINLNADDWNFVLTSAGESGYISKLSAVYSAGGTESISRNFAAMFSDVAFALIKADSSCAQALLDGNYSAFLKRLLSVWSDEEWQHFTDVVSSSQDSEAYLSYFTKIGVYDSFTAFSLDVECASLQQLTASSEENFYTLFKGYVASFSMELAFVLFEL